MRHPPPRDDVFMALWRLMPIFTAVAIAVFLGSLSL